MTEPDYQAYLRDLDKLTPKRLDEVSQHLDALVWAQLMEDRKRIDDELDAMLRGDPLVANLMVSYVLHLIGELLEHLSVVSRTGTDVGIWRGGALSVRRELGQIVDVAKLDLTARLPPTNAPEGGQP